MAYKDALRAIMIVDASVGVKWILSDETHRAEALFLLQRHANNTEALTVPDLFFHEIANALATKKNVSLIFLKRSLDVIFGANLNSYSPTNKEIHQAAQLAKRHGTTAYDMIYAVVAKNKQDTLITADEKFVEKTGFKFVKLLSEIELRD